MIEIVLINAKCARCLESATEDDAFLCIDFEHGGGIVNGAPFMAKGKIEMVHKNSVLCNENAERNGVAKFRRTLAAKGKSDEAEEHAGGPALQRRQQNDRKDTQ